MIFRHGRLAAAVASSPPDHALERRCTWDEPVADLGIEADIGQ
jgi:hypothetical protein